MNKLLLLILAIFSFEISATMSESFPAGKGAAYKVNFAKDPTPIHLSLYIAGTRVDSVHVEYFTETKGLLPLQMWQQFEIAISGKGPAKILKGYIQTKELTKPEIIPQSFLKGAQNGLQVNDFLFSDMARLQKHKIGDEIVEISAGTTKATHYRTSQNGQTVDYWISEQAKPIGLVMLTSRSKSNENQNYSLELINLIDNVKAKIKPENGVPLSEKGKTFLAKPESIK